MLRCDSGPNDANRTKHTSLFVPAGHGGAYVGAYIRCYGHGLCECASEKAGPSQEDQSESDCCSEKCSAVRAGGASMVYDDSLGCPLDG